MSLQKPNFTSQIPEPLLSDANERDKYILNSLSIISQNNSWLIDETIKQSQKLETLDKKVSYTNGSVNEHKKELAELNETKEDVKQIVQTKRFIYKYLLNKYALIGFAALVIGLIKIFTSPELRELLFKVLSLG